VVQGITYDTGGADIKHGGTMAGMHRDKCGAAFVAGFFQVLLTFLFFIYCYCFVVLLSVCLLMFWS